ncbi:MAG: glycosyltransferase family 4 protein [Planctomycetota bacterium]|jgi:glycosyltransferase involved in cell wall biosynthesis
MKVALIADSTWLMQELTTLRRLGVGLVGEGVGVIRVVPDWQPLRTDNMTMTGRQITYLDSRWMWLRQRRIHKALQALADEGVDVVHVMDGSLEHFGIEIGEQMGVPVVCGLWSRAGVDRLRGLRGKNPIVYAAATPGLVERCHSRLGRKARVELVPPGVYGSDETVPAPLEDPKEMLSCLIVGDGNLDSHYRALMEGLAKAKDRLGQVVYFFYAVNADQHNVWQFARKIGLLDQINLVPYEPGSRELMVQADVVIQPQPRGQVRSLVIEAMGAGRPVISAADPVLDYLQDGLTARIVDHPAPKQWAEIITQITREPGAYIELGEAARGYVKSHHSAAQYVERLHGIYQDVVTPEPIPFQSA